MTSIVASPNFGYEALVDAVTPDEVPGLDLSCWRVAFNGAEPVIPGAVERFVAISPPRGSRPRPCTPCTAWPRPRWP